MNKFEKYLFYLLLIILPVNLAKHFIFPFSYVNGVLVDYLIPTFYLTDLLLFGLLFVWVVREAKSLKLPRLLKELKERKTTIILLLFWVSLLPSVLLASNQPAAVYRYLKISEYVFLALYTARNYNFKEIFQKLSTLLSVGALFEGILVLCQFIKQTSLFSYLFFGEPVFNSSMFGVAKVEIFDRLFVRPYGTFPHPNVMGGYFALLFPWFIFCLFEAERRGLRRQIIWWGLVLVVSFTGLLLSFSRTAILVGIMGGLREVWGMRNLGILGGLRGGKKLETIPMAISLSITRRIFLAGASFRAILEKPFFGVGLNNFTVYLGKASSLLEETRFLQPVHNVFLLIFAESGVVAGVVFIVFLASVAIGLVRSIRQIGPMFMLAISLFQIILISLADHYFWTIQQTSIIFWLIIGFSLGYARLEK